MIRLIWDGGEQRLPRIGHVESGDEFLCPPDLANCYLNTGLAHKAETCKQKRKSKKEA